MKFAKRPHKDSRSNACVTGRLGTIPGPYDVIPPRAEASELLSPAAQRQSGEQPRCLHGRGTQRSCRVFKYPRCCRQEKGQSSDGLRKKRKCFQRSLEVKRPVFSHDHRVAPQSADFRFLVEKALNLWMKSLWKLKCWGKKEETWYLKVIRLVLFAEQLLKNPNLIPVSADTEVSAQKPWLKIYSCSFWAIKLWLFSNWFDYANLVLL